MTGGESSKAKTDSGERKEIAVTKIFCYVLYDQIDHNLWGEGTVKHRTYRKECEEKEGFWDPSGHDELVPNCLFWFSKGCALRGISQGEVYVKDQHVVSRSNMIASLR